MRIMPSYRSRAGHPKRLKKCYHGPTNTYILSSPIGELELVSCAKGIHSLGQVAGITDDTFKPDMSVEVSLLSKLYQDNGYTYKPVQACILWLNNYFHELNESTEQKAPTVCFVFTKGGSFTEKVLKTLMEEVAFGHTVSYKELAALSGNEKASRVVGTVMKNNHVQLIIPCHRVVQSSGTPGAYSGGCRNSVKEWLLQHERIVT